MTDKKYQIFISSTYTDLKEERESIIKAILEMYHIPIGMEMFSAEDEDQWEIIRRTIDFSDYYILILGLRYGSTTNDNISFTQKEYEYALQKKIPILAFILDENTPLSKDKRDDDLTQIYNFRNTVLKNSKMADFWTTTDELTKKVSISLMKQIMQKPAVGWIRGDKAISEEISKELTNLSKENRDLRNKLKELESKTVQRQPKITLTINKNNTISIDREKFYGFTKLKKPQKIVFEQIEPHLQNHITKEEIEEYNNKIPNQSIIDNYNQHYEKYYKIQNISSELELFVCNKGTIKANNIYIDIKFPNEILILENDTKIEEPNNPIPYTPLKWAETRYNETIQTKNTYPNRFTNPTLMQVVSPLSKLSKIKHFNKDRWTKLDNNSITIKINNLIHTKCIRFEDEYKIVPMTSGIHKVEISIICEEYELEDKQIINLKVEEL